MKYIKHAKKRLKGNEVRLPNMKTIQVKGKIRVKSN